MGVGYVEFDDDESCRSGWASVDGGEPFRIEGIGDLETGSRWVLNVKHFTIRKKGLFRIKHVLREDFFRLKPTILKRELGLSKALPAVTVQIISSVYSRVMRLLSERFEDDFFSADYSIPAYLASKLLPPKQFAIPPALGSDLAVAVKESTQENQAPQQMSVPRGASLTSYYFPRSGYSAYLFSNPLPTAENWGRVEVKGGIKKIGFYRGKSIKGTEAWLSKMKGLHESGVAMFLSVNVTSIDAGIAQYAQFGVGANYQRRYASLPEIIYLAEFCQLEVGSGFKCDSKVYSPRCKEVETGSISAGIASEVEWIALSTPVAKKYTPMGAYIRAYDRIACLHAAHEFVSAGLNFGSCGAGKVQLYLSGGQEKEAGELAAKLGMMSPANSFNR